MIVRFWRFLIAILVGNIIYFGIERYLPLGMQHQPYQLDWGLLMNFCICVVCYVLVRLIR